MSRRPIRHRILSIDGAGIYGLISAIWLRQLCERDPYFLAQGNVDLFAGISSGAVNALLLAKHEEPRKALLEGQLEAFWTQRIGVFSNQNPVSAWLSFFGITPWYDAESFLLVLQSYFGEMTLAELPQKALVSTFNWTGRNDPEFRDGPHHTWPVVRKPPPGCTWRPKLFTNLPGASDAHYRVVDIAYGSAAPAGFRPIRGGIGDAGTFTGNPSVEAIAAMARSIEGWDALDPSVYGAARDEHQGVPADHLDQIALLSIGDGSCDPSYWLENFNFGMLPMMIAPTNPFTQDWFSPVWEVTIQAPVKEAEYISRTLLAARFHRLDAQLMEMPMLLASLWARFVPLREQIFARIDEVTRSDKSRALVEETVMFLQNEWQHGPPFTARAKQIFETQANFYGSRNP